MRKKLAGVFLAVVMTFGFSATIYADGILLPIIPAVESGPITLVATSGTRPPIVFSHEASVWSLSVGADLAQ